MERVENLSRVTLVTLIFPFLLLGSKSQAQSNDADSDSEANPTAEAGADTNRDPAASERRRTPGRPKGWTPEFIFRVKDGKTLSTFVNKNEWFSQFRQTPFYQGALFDLAPVIFAPPDDFGSAAQKWKGRLIEYLYETLLQNRPMALHYFKRPGLVSPYSISIQQLSPAEIKIAQGLIQALRSSDPRPIQILDQSVSVTPLLVKNHRYALVLNQSCLSIGRDANAVAATALLCDKLPKLESDARVSINLDEAFRSLAGVREKFFGMKSEVHTDWSWNAQSSKFMAQKTTVELVSGQHVLLNDTIPDEFLHAIPANTFFAGAGFIPRPVKGFQAEQIQQFLASDKAALRKLKSMPVALAYIGIEKTPTRAASIQPVLLVQPSNLSETADQIQNLYKYNQKAEVFSRRVCKNTLALSNQKDALDIIEKSCTGKVPQLAQMPSALLAPFRSKSIGGAILLNPAKLISLYIRRGWDQSKKKLAYPDEIQKSIATVEQLPVYVFSGKASETALTMKAQ